MWYINRQHQLLFIILQLQIFEGRHSIFVLSGWVDFK